MLGGTEHAQTIELLQHAAFLSDFCCKLIYLTKFYKDLNETSNVACQLISEVDIVAKKEVAAVTKNCCSLPQTYMQQAVFSTVERMIVH